MKALFADEPLPRPAPPVGGELHQLGPGDGPDRLLRHRRRPARRGGRSPGRLRRAHRQLRQRLRRVRRQAHGRARRASSWWRPTATTSSPASSTTGTMEIGEVHPTLSPSMDIQVSSQPRAPAVRAARARRRRGGRADGRGSGPRARSRSTADRLGLLGEQWSARPPRRRRDHRPIIAPSARAHRHADRPPHRGRAGRRRGLPARRRRAHGVPGHRPPGQVPRRRRGGHRRAARRCPPHLADLFERPERFERGRRDSTSSASSSTPPSADLADGGSTRRVRPAHAGPASRP